MEDQKVVSEISGDELAGALGVNASSSLIGQLGMLVWPVKNAQSEAVGLMDERDGILNDPKLTPEQRAAKLKPIEAALQRIVLDAAALTALYSLPHFRLTTLSASAAKSVLSAGVMKDFLARKDRWTGSELPVTRTDWATAIGMPLNATKKQILAKLAELKAAREERERDHYLTDAVSTFSTNEVRLAVASRRGIANKRQSAAESALFLTCLATELREFLTLAKPRTVPLATAKRFGIAEPLCLLSAGEGKWRIEP